MPRADSPRVLVVEFGDLVADASPVSRVAEFGTGRKDRAVRLLGAMYSASGADLAAGGISWGMGLSANPEYETDDNIPSSVNAFRDLSIYAFAYQWRGSVLTVTGGYTIHLDTIFVPLYGIEAPSRQQAVFWNDTEASIRGRMELYYEPIDLGRTDIDSLHRVKGAFRRS